MNELHNSFLQHFADDEHLVDAVRAYLKEHAWEKVKNMRLIDELNLSNEQLGAVMRSYFNAIECIDNAFVDLRKYKGRAIKNTTNNLER
jgi:hypothetical protein